MSTTVPFPGRMGGLVMLSIGLVAVAGCQTGDDIGFEPVGSRLSVFGLNGRKPSDENDRSGDRIEVAGTALRADRDATGMSLETAPASMSVVYGGIGFRGIYDELDVVEESRDLMDLNAFGQVEAGWAQHLDPTGGAEDSFEAEITTTRDSTVYTTSDGRLTLRNMDGADGSGLTYATYGYWSAEFAPFDRLVAFTLADRNAGTTIPAIETATYQGAMTGIYSASIGATTVAVAGDASLTVDFGGPNVSGQITDITAGAESLRDVALQQTALTGSTFAGAAATLPADAGQTGPEMAGDYAGGLYGPMAPEAVGAFALTGAGGEALVGGFAARR